MIGLVISVGIHLMLIAAMVWLVHPNIKRLASDTNADTKRIYLQLRLLAPVVENTKLVPLPRPVDPATERKAARPLQSDRKTASRNIRSTSPDLTPDQNTGKTVITALPAEPKAETPGQHIDYGNLGKLAAKSDEIYRAQDQRPVAQLERHPLYPDRPDSPLARGIANAERPDCVKNAQGAGLFAPLVLVASVVMDKKDSGCKFK